MHVGQFARLKFSAYDFAIHGSLQGIVTIVSADTITNEEGESFFLVKVKPVKSFLGVKSGELPIKIGMTVEADIIKPVTKTLRGWLFCMAFISIGLESNFRDLAGQMAGGKPMILYVVGQSFNLILTLFMAWLMFEVIFRDMVQGMVQ